MTENLHLDLDLNLDAWRRLTKRLEAVDSGWLMDIDAWSHAVTGAGRLAGWELLTLHALAGDSHWAGYLDRCRAVVDGAGTSAWTVADAKASLTLADSGVGADEARRRLDQDRDVLAQYQALRILGRGAGGRGVELGADSIMAPRTWLYALRAHLRPVPRRHLHKTDIDAQARLLSSALAAAPLLLGQLVTSRRASAMSIPDDPDLFVL